MTSHPNPPSHQAPPDSPNTAQKPVNPAMRLRTAIDLMLTVIGRRIKSLMPPNPTPEDWFAPKPEHPTPEEAKTQRALDRANYTYDWIIALARTLAGSKKFVLPWRFPRMAPITDPAALAALRALKGLSLGPLKQVPNDYTRELAAMPPCAGSSTPSPPTSSPPRLARRCGIDKQSDYWPKDLMEITQTPIAWAKANPPNPEKTSEPPEPAPPAPSNAGPPAEPDSANPVIPDPRKTPRQGGP